VPCNGMLTGSKLIVTVGAGGGCTVSVAAALAGLPAFELTCTWLFNTPIALSVIARTRIVIVHVPFTPSVAPARLMLYPSVVASPPPQLVLPPSESAPNPIGNVSLKLMPVSVAPLATGFALLIVMLNWLQPCHWIVAGSKLI